MKVVVTFPCTFTLDVDPDQFRDQVAAQIKGAVRAVNPHNLKCAAKRADRVAAMRERLERDICCELPPTHPHMQGECDPGQSLTSLRQAFARGSSAGRTVVSEALAQLVDAGKVYYGPDGRYRAVGGRPGDTRPHPTTLKECGPKGFTR